MNRASIFFRLWAAGILTISCFACDNKNPAGTEPAASASAAPASSAVTVASTAPSAAPAASAAPESSVATTPVDGGPACGSKANPCPMQGWMQKNAQPAMATNDAAKVGAVLEQIAKMTPPGAYPKWEKISLDGAAAGKSGDFAAAKASCRTCHEEYKSKYKNDDRARKI